MKLFMTLFATLAFVLGIALPVEAAEKGRFATEPSLNDGKKWRVAYYEGGPYIDYQRILTATLRELMALGWIEPAEFPNQTGEETTTLWRWLAADGRSKYLEFLPTGHYSGDWDEKARAAMIPKLLDRLNSTKDVDLLIAMGTWAGKDMANDQHKTPTLIFSASDPIAAGIIKSINDSGYAHVHATIDPAVYERQIRVFHEIVGFKRLGIAYEDSVDGRSYAAVDIVEKVAKDRGFEVVHCLTKSDIGDVQREAETVRKCFNEFAEKVDAIYVTQQGGVRLETIPSLVQIANERNIPTFSQAGSEEVKYGFLASISQADYKYVGAFQAKVMAKVFNGAQPRQLGQAFEQPPKIAINLKTAELIGFDPPIVLLGAADEIFHTISKP